MRGKRSRSKLMSQMNEAYVRYQGKRPSGAILAAGGARLVMMGMDNNIYVYAYAQTSYG